MQPEMMLALKPDAGIKKDAHVAGEQQAAWWDF